MLIKCTFGRGLLVLVCCLATLAATAQQPGEPTSETPTPEIEDLGDQRYRQ